LLVEAADLDIAQAIPLLLGEDRATDIRCAVVISAALSACHHRTMLQHPNKKKLSPSAKPARP